MKLNLKQTVVLSWIWYVTKILFWATVGTFFVYGFTLMISETDKKLMQDSAGSAVICCFFVFAAFCAILQTIWKYPKRRKGWTHGFERRPVYYWDNLINNNYE